MNHTPGPWKAFNSKNGRIFKHWQVDTGTGSVTLNDATHWEAGNAHLIAAAPAMYEALQQAQELLRSLVAEEMIHTTELQRVGNCQATMWQALAQAEGK